MSKSVSCFCGPEYAKDYSEASAVILPVPFDKTSSWGKGADKGPAAIIEASEYLEFYDIETGSEVYKKGIFTDKPLNAFSSSALLEKTEARVSHYLKENKLLVTLGGDHSVSIGVMRAHAKHFRNLSILHLDAHGDSRDSYEGNPYSHACVIARAREHTRNIVSAGIRSIDSSELYKLDKKRTFFARDIHDSDEWIEKAVSLLTDNVYISIDVDVFDPGIMPSTGTPEPGGLGWYQVIHLLSAVSKSKKIVGFDVVELCPSKTKAPDFLAAKLIYTLLSYIYANRSDQP